MAEVDIPQRATEIHDLLQNEDAEDREKLLIDLCVPLTADQRMEVLKYYKANFSEDGIVADIRNIFQNTRFAKTLAGLFVPRPDYLCHEIHKRLEYYISEEDIIFEVLVGSPKWLLDCIKERYENLYGSKLEDDLKKAYRADVKRNVLTLLNTERSTNKTPDEAEMERCADILAKSAPTAWSASEDIFNEIFAKKSPDELLEIGRKYYEKTGITMSQQVEEKLTGRVQVLMRELLYGVINPAEYMAIKLRHEIKNIGVDTNNLDRIMISRYDVDMPLIRIFYLQMYGLKIYEDLEDVTVGSYRDLLVAMAKEMTHEQCQQIIEENAKAY